MLSHADLSKGVKIIIENNPYEVLEANPMKKAQRRVVIQAKIKNLITGSVLLRNFHQGEVFEEADMSKFEANFLYCHKDKCFFAEKDNPAKRFDLPQSSIGNSVKFLKANQIVQGLLFGGNVINVTLPIKIQLKVTEAPPGLKGDRAQSGTKLVTLETGAKINAPLFIGEGDVLEVNTETGEYVKRAE